MTYLKLGEEKTVFYLTFTQFDNFVNEYYGIHYYSFLDYQYGVKNDSCYEYNLLYHQQIQ